MKKIMTSIILLGSLIVSCGGGTTKAESDTIKVGAPLALTGEVSQYGIATKKGMDLRVEEINANGGIKGKKLEIVYEDTKGDLQEAVNVFKSLASSGDVTATIGATISTTTLGVARLAQEAKMPFVVPTGTAFDITKDRDYVFRVTVTDPYQGVVLARYTKEKEFGKTAILVNKASDYSVGVANAFLDEAKKVGLDVVVEEYTKDDKDFKSVLTNFKNSGIEALVIPDYYNTIGLMLTQAKEIGFNPQYLGVDGWDGIQENFGELAEGAIFTSQFATDNTSDIVNKFLTGFKNKFGEDPILFGALGYDSVSVLADALENAKDLSSESIKEALKNTNMDLVTGRLTFDENRNPNKATSMIEVKGGKLTLKEVLENK